MTKEIPPEIAKAIVVVMANVGKVAKAEFNNFSKYKFASIDGFLEAVNPACSQAGLSIIPLEKECDVERIEVTEKGDVKTETWVKLEYQFLLAHETGASWTDDSCRRTIMTKWTGAQTFGAAQSYLLKQFMRGLFQIATGDKEDLDNTDNREQAQKKPVKKTQKKKYDADTSAAEAEFLSEDLKKIDSLKQLDTWISKNDGRYEKLLDDDQRQLRDLTASRRSELQQTNGVANASN